MWDECLHDISHLLSQDEHLEFMSLRNPLSLVRIAARHKPETCIQNFQHTYEDLFKYNVFSKISR